MNLSNKPLRSILIIHVIMLHFFAFSLEGMITVLEAPMWNKPNQSSTIIQYLRRGDIVTIIDMPVLNAQFVPVWDKLAKPAYLDVKHLKIFTADAQELETKSINQDPTDYRLNEPIPSNYPVSKKQEGNIWHLFE